MKTKELPLFGIQSQAVCVIRKYDTVEALLINGKTLYIKCGADEEANEIKNTILYYPVASKNNNNAVVFNFEFEISVY